MTISTLQATQARLQAAFQHDRNGIFDPYEGNSPDPKTFSRDYDRMANVLIYGHQTLYDRYKQDFDDINDLNQAQAHILNTRQLQPLQTSYDAIEETLQTLSTTLQKKVTEEFKQFLQEKLGRARQPAISPILSMFSQKALTALIHQVNEYTKRRYKGVFIDDTRIDHCVLDIPQDATQPVQIRVTSHAIYQHLIRPEQQEKENHPVEITSKAVYTIDLDGKTEGQASFHIRELV